jgi:hypothetical protein
MKQGDTKKLKPKDRHKSAWWTRRDDSRKAKQEAFAAAATLAAAEAEAADILLGQGDPDAEARVSENA